MRPRRKSLKTQLPAREAAICRRIAEARDLLELNQAGAARKIGIPKSTLSNYELCIVPLKAALALRICRHLIISEEWLATGRSTSADAAGKQRNIASDPSLKPIYIRQCMDLAGTPEAAALPPSLLFSEAFDDTLAPIYAARLKTHFYHIGIPFAAWTDTNLGLGRDILVALVERNLLLLTNAALGRDASKEHAGSVYLGFVMRMAMFGFQKCLGQPVSADQVGLPLELFADPKLPIEAFKSAEELRAAKEFAPLGVPGAPTAPVKV